MASCYLELSILFYGISLICLIIQAYVQQLETSRIRLTQLEHEIQRARSQVINFNFSYSLLNYFNSLLEIKVFYTVNQRKFYIIEYSFFTHFSLNQLTGKMHDDFFLLK